MTSKPSSDDLYRIWKFSLVRFNPSCICNIKTYQDMVIQEIIKSIEER